MELPGVRMTAVCDVNSTNLERGRQQAGGDGVAAYHDFRKLLQDDSIDAVIVATQAHWHVPIGVAACQAGKNVYLENPMGNSRVTPTPWLMRQSEESEAASCSSRLKTEGPCVS